METLKIADKTFTSRLFTGTGKFSSNQVMEEAIIASESQLVTVAMKRIRMEDKNDDMLEHILPSRCTIITQHLRRTGCQGSHFCRSIIPGSFRYQLAENWKFIPIPAICCPIR